ncbi:MAG: hypothetical protein AMXMBFR53_17740 [Gemmatimonadota bacterium]
MVVLVAITALLLLVSGGVKMRAAARVGLGLPALAVLEILAGVGVLSQAFVIDLPPGRGLGLVVGSVLLLVVSSVQVGRAVRRRQRLRTASEGARLANYVKYLSREDSPPNEPGR